MPTLMALPAISIDHLGLSKEGFPNLLKLVENGARVKASGFGRGDLDIRTAIHDITRASEQANGDALMFGTDLPSTRAPRAYRDQDLALLIDSLPPEQVERVLCRNALTFYRLDEPEHSGSRATTTRLPGIA
jgi:predicted TIM-barrel fold metal-dependent hydrolase